MATARMPLALTAIATLVAWGAWVLTIALVDPEAAGTVHLLLFYSTLLAAVAGSATLIGLWVRRRASDRLHAVVVAIRQGALVAIAVTIAVWLSSRGFLTWMNLILLIAALTALEMFLISLRGTVEPEHTGT